MFGQQDAAFFIESLFKMNARDVYVVGDVPGWHNALMVSRPTVPNSRIDTIADGHPLWLLDYIPSPTSHVVPQKMLTPQNQPDWRPYLEHTNLRMPIFFVQHNGLIGLPLPRATVGDTETLRCADNVAPLGGGHFTQIRISWPGYELWERQIYLKDLTRFRNDITLRHFAKLVARIVDRFLTHAAVTVPIRDLSWRVGVGGITRDDVIIVGVVQVSTAGWMPILQIS
ncbi:hypothetical protein F5148DRAFT_312916 [Russula earlei]|uniref:Uncharacterized protein n=1 Tax=Russula earlei TaxID=71964 RepID=A0ACC0U2S0_9AGAM|nr:hypothetical protein F5148DRAFT_312916 [Russula earlei]